MVSCGILSINSKQDLDMCDGDLESSFNLNQSCGSLNSLFYKVDGFIYYAFVKTQLALNNATTIRETSTVLSPKRQEGV